MNAPSHTVADANLQDTDDAGVEDPPAFPFGGNKGLPPQTGMSLRDWFAGQALAGFLADGGHRGVDAACRDEPAFLGLGPRARMSVINLEVADASYRMADAMLAARAQVQP